ncbi:hypothetical protein X566_03650 [Afipia sp. P52-10]|jgi:hypothetical protein|uniref:DUF3551 domain-containing protein n=1 Tax=Afipia sp. P52-10 TaxID=1429916 RepID=UPI0003DF2AFE|nr:DUF3551 domain-containing protein [Afipia sp. P52-10]ETR76818.1 hypothetical protein X566_03650 [Afipia sp. P52-10]
MRSFILAAALTAGALLAGTPATAETEYPYCTSGGWGTDGSCSFATLQQCQAFVRGVGGSCVLNPRVAQRSNPNNAMAGPRRISRD